MARIRTIKPEFPHSESMGKVSRDARLCFILLFTLADDEGRLRGNSRMLASLLFPYDDDAKAKIDRWLDELVEVGSIVRYQCEGDSFIEIAKWLSHQKIDRPSKSKIPPPNEGSRGLAKDREDSALDQGRDQGKDQGKDKAPTVATPSGVSDSIWQDFVKHRKTKKAQVTQTVIDGIRREAEKAGWSLEDALRETIVRNWQSFKAEWVADKNLSKTGQTNQRVLSGLTRGLIGGNGDVKLLG